MNKILEEASEKGFKAYLFEYCSALYNILFTEELLLGPGLISKSDTVEPTIYMDIIKTWLRDKHDIHISIDPIPNIGDRKWSYSILFLRLCIEESSFYKLSGIITGFNSYDKALEDGIFAALKQLS